MSPSYGNVFFLSVARIANQAIIVASHSYNTVTDLGAVKQVLEQPNMSMAPGKHYSFTVNKLAWHLIAGKSHLLIPSVIEKSLKDPIPLNNLLTNRWPRAHIYFDLRDIVSSTVRACLPRGPPTPSKLDFNLFMTNLHNLLHCRLPRSVLCEGRW